MKKKRLFVIIVEICTHNNNYYYYYTVYTNFSVAYILVTKEVYNTFKLKDRWISCEIYYI